MIRELQLFVKSNQISFVGFCILLDLILTIIIIIKVNYTEIDWVAYMQEVEGYLQGERDYSLLKGDTGPLVYPAGFVYFFVFLRYLTAGGLDIRQGQYIFAIFYLVVLALVMFLYRSGNKVPIYIWPLLMLSKRIHSIFVLRLFNDCIAVMLGYGALLLFTSGRWKSGSVMYSLAVGIKMNMLLWAPGVLLVFLLGTGVYGTVMCLSICAIVQLLLGYPFLTTHPIQYIANSFNLGRQFMYKWTVNLKFLSEAIFLSKKLSILLLVLTVVAYVLYGYKIITTNTKALTAYRKTKNKHARVQNFKDLLMIGHIHLDGSCGLSPHFVISTVFISNFIGIVFARYLLDLHITTFFPCIISYHIISYHTIPYHTIPYHIISW